MYCILVGALGLSDERKDAAVCNNKRCSRNPERKREKERKERKRKRVCGTTGRETEESDSTESTLIASSYSLFQLSTHLLGLIDSDYMYCAIYLYIYISIYIYISVGFILAQYHLRIYDW